ncbi:MAG: hypothetical protein H7Y08_10925 [Rhizobiaceae bacterium]|nr:hypothetical protein [Rhizobiaceae bacterium]
MSATGGVTLSIPLLYNRRVDAAATGSKISDLFHGRKEASQPKVVDHKGSGSVTVKATGARTALDLTAMHRAASQPPRVPVNGALLLAPQAQVQNPQAQGVQAPVLPVAQGGQLAPLNPPPTADVALAAIRDTIALLRTDDLQTIGTLHRQVRSDKGFAPTVAKSEVKLLDRQTAAQAAITAELGKVEALIKQNANAAPPLREALTSARRELIVLSLAVEYPQTIAAARADFGAAPPTLSPNFAKADRDMLGRVEVAARTFVDRHPTNDRPDRHGAVSPGAAGRFAANLDGVIDDLDAKAPDADTKAAIAYLKDVKTAVLLRGTLESAVDQLGALRDRFGGDAELSKVSVGRLAREFSHYGAVHQDSASAKPIDQLHALETIDSLSHCLANKAVPDIFVTDDPGVSKMLSALRTEQCRDLAVAKFVADATDPAFVKAFDDLGDRLGRVPTRAEIAAIVPQGLKADFDRAAAGGELAAKTREAFLGQRDRLQRILGEEGAVAYRPAIWLKVGGHHGGADVSTKETRGLDVLQKLGKKNPEAAFMVAGLAVLEHQVAKLDSEVLGLKQYEAFDLADFDAGRVMSFAGVTEKQMLKLGYTAAEADNFPKAMHNLSKAGFTDVAQLERHVSFLQKATSATLTDQSVQNMIGDAAAGSAGSVGKRLLTTLLSEAASLQTGQPPKSGGDPTLKAETADVKLGFAKIATAAHRAVSSDAGKAQRLGDNTTLFQAAESTIVDLMGQRALLDTRVVEARQTRAAARTKDVTRGLDMSAEKPAGLRSAKAILVAVDKEAELVQLRSNGGSRDDIARTTKERDTALDQLRGFDAETMRRPWHGKLAGLFGSAEKPDIGKLATLRDAASAIVFLREGAKAERAVIDAKIGTEVALRQDRLAERQVDNREAILGVRQMVRAAVLAHWPADVIEHKVDGGKVVAAYQPALKRTEIEATLTGWGLDVAMFAPEVSEALNGTLERHDLANWADERKAIDPNTGLAPLPDTRSGGRRVLDALGSELKEIFTREGAKNAMLTLANKHTIDEGLRSEIGALHGAMKEGDKFDFKTGYKLSLNTGKIPLEPSATVGIRGKMAASSLANLVLERSGDGFKVTARFGAQVQVGVDVLVDQRLTPEAMIGVSAGVEVTGSYLHGITETFPNTDAGRKACADLLLALTGGEKPKASIFEQASDAATNREVAGKAGVGAKGYAKAEFTTQPFGNDGNAFAAGPDDKNFKSGANNKIGIGASAGIEVAASLGGKYNVVRSFNKVAISTEVELTGSIGANAKFYAKIPTATGAAIAKIMQDSGGQQAADQRFDKDPTAAKVEGSWTGGNMAADEDILSADASMMLARSKKYKQEYNVSDREDGRDRLTKAEIVQRSNLRLGKEYALIGIGSKDLAEKLETDATFRKDYEALKSFMGNEDYLQITYGLTPANIERVADLMARADDHAESGHGATAAFLRGKATSILDKQESYEATKVTVLTKSTAKEQVNRGNAVLLRFDITAEMGSENAEVTLKVPPKKVA